MTDLPKKPPENKEKPEIAASELDDETLIDRLFPNELIDWVKEKFARDEEE